MVELLVGIWETVFPALSEWVDRAFRPHIIKEEDGIIPKLRRLEAVAGFAMILWLAVWASGGIIGFILAPVIEAGITLVVFIIIGLWLICLSPAKSKGPMLYCWRRSVSAAASLALGFPLAILGLPVLGYILMPTSGQGESVHVNGNPLSGIIFFWLFSWWQQA